MTYRVSSAHEEGGERVFAVSTEEFEGADGMVTGLRLVDVEWVQGRFIPVEGSSRVLPADLVFLALGFTGPEVKEGLAAFAEKRKPKFDPGSPL